MDANTIRAIIAGAPYEDVARTLAELAGDPDLASLAALREFLTHRDGHTYGKFITPRLAARAFIQKGPPGVEALVDVLPHAPGAIYPRAILEALWYASHGQLPPARFFDMADLRTLPAPLDVPPSAATQHAAVEAVQDLVVEASADPTLFHTVFGFFFEELTATSLVAPADEPRLRSRILEILSESTIRLTARVLRDFERLIDARYPEEVYQRFLTEHPVLVDPLASEVIPKQRLGLEFITDFAVRRHDRRYVLVEIEKPHDRLFTDANDFTAHFTHAVGQVLDFQQWVDANKAYAHTLLPDISSPRGLLIMGRRGQLTSRTAEKLHRFCVNSVAVEVLTFDDVLVLGRNLYESIHRRR